MLEYLDYANWYAEPETPARSALSGTHLPDGAMAPYREPPPPPRGLVGFFIRARDAVSGIVCVTIDALCGRYDC
jgi:hypothetical protein